jgi:NDP-sugar pyrophosphorylase family protein
VRDPRRRPGDAHREGRGRRSQGAHPRRGRALAHHQLSQLARSGVTEVVYCIGHLGRAIRGYVGGGERWGLEVHYVDEGDRLRGTGGALRLALDEGALAPAFLVLYGDSYLPIDYRAVWAAFERSGKPALMTVFRNEERWDKSNVVFENGQVILYDKRRRAPNMAYIDYGLSVLTRGVVEKHTAADLADLYHQLSVSGELAGHEVNERFYEIGSPSGLEDLGRYLATLVTSA